MKIFNKLNKFNEMKFNGMQAIIEFDKTIDQEKEEIMVNGFTIELKNGQEIDFEFNKVDSRFISDTELLCRFSDLDLTYPNTDKLNKKSMENCSFKDFNIYIRVEGENENDLSYPIVKNIHNTKFLFQLDKETSTVFDSVEYNKEIPVSYEKDYLIKDDLER